MVFTHRILCNDMDVDDYIVRVDTSYTDNCPVCSHPLDRVYYGGGIHKWECEVCGKHYVTEIDNLHESK